MNLPAIEAHLPDCVLLRPAELDQSGAGNASENTTFGNISSQKRISFTHSGSVLSEDSSHRIIPQIKHFEKAKLLRGTDYLARASRRTFDKDPVLFPSI